MDTEDLTSGAGKGNAITASGPSFSRLASRGSTRKSLQVSNRLGLRRSGRERERLAATLKTRIEARTAGRVRNLVVVVNGDYIELHGSCATFYTKQLAQHAAMGVLEDEELVNSICVGV